MTATPDLPPDWGASTVGEEFTVQLGKMLDAAKNRGEPRPYLGNAEVQWGRLHLEELPLVRLSPADMKKYRLQKGDLLVCEGGEVGRAAIWEEDLPECYYQKALHRLRPRRGYDPKIMAAFLRLWSDNGALANYVTQTSIAHLPRERLIEIPLPVPPVPEQRAIAAALSDADALVAALDALIAKKRAMKQGAKQQLLTGKMRLPGFGQKDAFSMTDCGPLPRDWECIPLRDALAQQPSYGVNAAATEPSGDLPMYIRITDIDDHGRFAPNPPMAVDHPRAKHYLLTAGDIVVARTGASVGKSYLYRPADGALVFAGFLILLRPQQSALDPSFLFYYLRTSTYWSWIDLMSMRSGQPGVNGREYAGLPVPCPTIKEQRAIAQVLMEMDSEITALEARREKAKMVKQGMMQALLTGRVRLPVQEEASA